MKRGIFFVVIFILLVIVVINYDKIISINKVKVKLSFLYDREKIYEELGLNRNLTIFYFFSEEFKNRIKKYDFIDQYYFYYTWFNELTIDIYHKEIVANIVINNQINNLTINSEFYNFRTKETYPLIIIRDKIEKEKLKFIVKDLWILKKKYNQIYENLSQIDILESELNTINLHFRTYSNYVTLKKNINVENIIESYFFISKISDEFYIYNTNFTGIDGSYFVNHQ